MGEILPIRGDITPSSRPDDYIWAIKRIKHLLAHGNVIPLYHARLRGRERNLNNQDVQHIIRTGMVVDHSHPGDLWRYVVEGTTAESDKAACVVEIDERDLIIVSAYFKHKKKK